MKLHSDILKINKKGDLIYLTFPIFEKYGIPHAFTTRKGGVSTGDCAEFNTGFERGEPEENVLENYRLICDAIGIKRENLIAAKQTHTVNLLRVTEKDAGKGIVRPRDFDNIDGLLTNEKNIGLVTQYADCTPLAFYDTKTGAVANSHSGWRGTAKEMGRVTVERMQKEFDTNPKDIVAVIGPTIDKCCYEVDDNVYNSFAEIPYLRLEDIFTPSRDGHYMLSLKEANRQILINAGIKEENIEVADLCTFCNHEYLHSHRYTGGKRGNLAMILTKPQ